jgi:hypothetical protein
VVIERNEPAPQTPPSGQLTLFELLEGRLEVICTNQRLSAANVWRLYNRGAVVEQVIEELKNDLAATDIRTDRFWANDTLFLTGLVAYNLLNALRRLTLPRAYRAARLKRVSFLFLTLGANVVRHARGMWIKIGRDYPLRLNFYRAWAALAPA